MAKKMLDETKKSEFSPINKAHAIVEVVFFFQFAEEFSQPIVSKLQSLRKDLAEELPKANELTRFHFGIKNQPGHSPETEVVQALGGIELQSIKKDGSVEWMLRAKDNELAVHCLDYTRWENVWEKASNYLSFALQKLEGFNTNPVSLGLKYVDRFIFDGKEEEYQLSDILQQSSGLVFKKAFNSGTLWHCHTGWFDKLSITKYNYLNQLNIDASYITISGKRRHIITIDHNAVVNDATEMDKLSSIFTDSEDKNIDLDSIMKDLHRANKNLLANLLTEKMAKQIMLNVEAS